MYLVRKQTHIFSPLYLWPNKYTHTLYDVVFVPRDFMSIMQAYRFRNKTKYRGQLQHCALETNLKPRQMVGPANRVVIKISKIGVNEVVIVTSQTRALEFYKHILLGSWTKIETAGTT